MNKFKKENPSNSKMETPVTTRQRSRLRSNPKTPSNDKQKDDSIKIITPIVNAIEDSSEDHSLLNFDQDDEEEAFPPTQAFQNVRKKGEVYWDFDARSPKTGGDMRKKLLQEDSPGQTKPKSPPRPLTPTMIFQTKRKLRSSPLVDDEGLDLLNECKKLSDLAKKSETKSPNVVIKSSRYVCRQKIL